MTEISTPIKSAKSTEKCHHQALDPNSSNENPGIGKMDSENFYKAFEDKYRGSRDLIKSRLSAYIPFVLPLKKSYPESKIKALDIGCGRGEWLELLRQEKIDALGVDLDEGMLSACRKLDLSVETVNGIEFLKKAESESLHIISAFHVVEHISFEELQSLVFEAKRALKPGGLLILETPNPENLRVASERFYLDPSHKNPLPSQLLSFLPEFYGYERVKSLGLQEPEGIRERTVTTLMQVIEDVSPDHGIIAQKKGGQEILGQFDEIFSKGFGVSLKSLGDNFEGRILHIEDRIFDLETQIEQARADSAYAWSKFNEVIGSKSWKITKPLRVAIEIYRKSKTSTRFLRPSHIKNQFNIFKFYVKSNPKLKSSIQMVLTPFPGIKEKLKRLGETTSDPGASYVHVKDIEDLSPQAKKIYGDLTTAIDAAVKKKS